MSTASAVPQTHGELEGDEALETLRRIGVLLWSFAAAVALFLGVAFAAQLEAVRAGVEAPRLDRDANA